jgi:hypothetical protein
MKTYGSQIGTGLTALLSWGMLVALADVCRGNPQGDIDAIWNDPVFKKQFIAGYGINSEIEPRVTPDEVSVLEKIRPLMAENLPKAEESLRKQMKRIAPRCWTSLWRASSSSRDKWTEALASYRKAVESSRASVAPGATWV